jgi:hypothetical protein
MKPMLLVKITEELPGEKYLSCMLEPLAQVVGDAIPDRGDE